MNTKVTVISGFLGAGKTTLISKLIKEVFPGEKVVLVENEFGEIGIDGGFLKESGIEIREMNSGCICCTLKGDFEAALKSVIDTYTPDRILIEPSGVGKLSDILNALNAVEGAEADSYSTVVDAKRCKVYHKNFKEFFDDQIKTAQTIILSRTQETTQDKLAEDIDIIHEINPSARIITTPWEELSGKDIFNAMMGTPVLCMEDDHEHHHEHDEECCCGHDHEHHHEHDEECCCGHDHEHHHEHDEECCCGHDHEHHHEHDEECCCGHHHHHGHDADEVFSSIGLETVHRFSKEEIEHALSSLDENIVRAKGIVMNSEGGWLFFDYVPGDIDIREGSPAYTGLVTIIGTHPDEEALKSLFPVK